MSEIDLLKISYPAFWLIAAIILGIIEAFTPALVSVWLMIGALAAWVCAILGLPFIVQLVVFVIVSYVLLITTRPIVKKWLTPKIEKTNADRLIGQIGIVSEKIRDIEGIGQVKVSGQVWSARSADGTEIEPGTQVTITAITGVKLMVTQSVQNDTNLNN